MSNNVTMPWNLQSRSNSSVSSSRGVTMPANFQRSATVGNFPVSHRSAIPANAVQRSSTVVECQKTIHSSMIRTHSNFEFYINRVYRGHQERQQRKKENEMAIVIQRRYRRHLSTSEDKNQTKEVDNTKVLEDRREKRKDRDRAWRDKNVATKKTNDVQVSKQVQQELHSFQDEIVQLKWQADQQVEQNFMMGTAPPRVVFISSKLGKSELLAEAAHDKPNIMVIPYSFERDTFDGLIEKMRSKLNAYKHGCRAQSVCIYCQGGPGFLYIVQGKVLTVVKIKKPSEKDQREFWVSIGDMMSKVDPENTVIHVMGCHILGKENGQELFDHIPTLMKPNIVKLKSPLELSEEGKAMVDLYFDNEKYKEWKLQRYIKTDSLINRYKES